MTRPELRMLKGAIWGIACGGLCGVLAVSVGLIEIQSQADADSKVVAFADFKVLHSSKPDGFYADFIYVIEHVPTGDCLYYTGKGDVMPAARQVCEHYRKVER